MLLPILLLGGGVAAILLLKDKSPKGGGRDPQAPPVAPLTPSDITPRHLEDLIVIIAGKKTKTRPNAVRDAVRIATALNLPLTARALATPKPKLPNNELWPGTNFSVAAYMTQTIARRKLTSVSAKSSKTKKVKKTAKKVASAARTVAKFL